jgi:hypothetical protein
MAQDNKQKQSYLGNILLEVTKTKSDETHTQDKILILSNCHLNGD